MTTLLNVLSEQRSLINPLLEKALLTTSYTKTITISMRCLSLPTLSMSLFASKSIITLDTNLSIIMEKETSITRQKCIIVYFRSSLLINRWVNIYLLHLYRCRHSVELTKKSRRLISHLIFALSVTETRWEKHRNAKNDKNKKKEIKKFKSQQ